MKVPVLLALAAMLAIGTLAEAQETRRKKPVLIRRDTASDVKSEPEVIEPDPIQARQNIEVGDFYYKRGNYKAAADRFRDAVKYGPKNPEAYQKLIRALEKQDDYASALDVCLEFIQENPQSDKVAEFEKKSDQLKAKMDG